MMELTDKQLLQRAIEQSGEFDRLFMGSLLEDDLDIRLANVKQAKDITQQLYDLKMTTQCAEIINYLAFHFQASAVLVKAFEAEENDRMKWHKALKAFAEWMDELRTSDGRGK